MIETYNPLSARVKTYQTISDQIPEFARSENPLFADFMKQYYISQEFQGGPVDIAENIDAYIKVDNLTKDVISGSVTLQSSITSTDDTIVVSNNTKGFPQKWGLLKIDNEIITYTDKTPTSFTGCIRGFSGITTFRKEDDPKNLEWSQSTATSHTTDTKVENLSALFLKELYEKLKALYTPGLEGVQLSPELDVNNFIKEARSLYESKGTDESFKILFKALFGLEPKINDLEQFLIKPSYANYLRRDVFAVELISGNPFNIVGRTLFQDADPNNPNIGAASGPISDVASIRDNFYKISVFVGYDERDLITGEFVVPGKTRCVGKVGLGASVITVDSTIGFPQEGTIQIGQSGDSFYQELNYKEKTVNQFIQVDRTTIDIPSNTDIFTPNIVYGYEDNDATKPVLMRITGVLSNFVSEDDLYGLKLDSKIKVKQLGRFVINPQVGKNYEQIFFNSWYYNTSVRYQINSFSGSILNLAGSIDRSSIKVGDTVELLQRNTEVVVAPSLKITATNPSTNTVTVSGSFTTTPGLYYDIRRIQNKANSTETPIIGGQYQILSDITNTYVLDSNNSPSGKKEGYVTSNSLPSYNIATKKIKATLINPSIAGGNWQGYESTTNKYSIISFPSSVPFRTGDEVFYIPELGTELIGGLSSQKYFVEVLNPNNRIKLYSSRSFIPSGISLEFTPPATTTGVHNFVRSDQAGKSIFPGRSIRRFILEQDLKTGKEQQTTSERTLDGNTGLLVNGVEIVNYKSDKLVYYGPLKSLDIGNAGYDYDVLNAPNITIDRSTTSDQALGKMILSGSIKDVLVDPNEYDIKKISSIDVYGGNGSGAKLEAYTELNFRELFFNAAPVSSGGAIFPSLNQFQLAEPHYYKDGDRVIYSANGNNQVGIATTGAPYDDLTLVNGQSYYVKTQTDKIFYLHRSKTDAVLGINTVFISADAANTNSGIHKLRDYNSKRKISKLIVLDEGSNYSNRMVIAKPTGISTTRDYIEFEDHGFSDGEVVHYGISTSGGSVISGLSTTYQYQVLKIDDSRFRLCYSGLATTRTPDTINYDNKEYVRLTSTGSGYQIFNYPPVTVDITVITDADTPQTINATPIVRGEVTDTILYERGSNYGTTILNFENTPRVTVTQGSFGQIGVVISNGRIIDAFVQAGGFNYPGPPDIIVNSTTPGASGAKLRAVVTNGSISDIIVVNQGIGYDPATTTITVSSPGNAASFSTRIRELVANKYITSNTLNGDFLGSVEDGLAIQSVAYGASVRTYFGDTGSGHSPIIGWAYDGNPIYGPFGLDDPDNIQSSSRRMRSSYVLDPSRIENRPSLADFPAGFFISDYYYDGSGDLDDHNGRFTKTPEFEQGVYAYFATVDNLLNPVFPYYIGDTFRSFAIRENVVAGERISQTTYSFLRSNLVRNTFPYKMFGDGASYDFVYQPYRRLDQISFPETIDTGNLENIRVAAPGTGYSTGSRVYFNNEGTGGFGADAIVSEIEGKSVLSLETEFQNYQNAYLEWNRDRITAHFDPYHSLGQGDVVQISGLSTTINRLSGSHLVSNINYSSSLISNGFVGFTTDIQVQYIPPNISIGSSIGIGTEVATILNIFDDNVLRIRRSIGVTTNTVGTAVTYFQDKVDILVSTPAFDSKVPSKLFFNPTESVGFGTTVGQTITRDYMYLGSTKTRSLFTQTIFVGNHDIRTNDLISFTTPSGASNISCATSSVYAGTFNLPSTVYAVRKTNQTIGIKTTKDSSEIFFISGGDDRYDYQFTTQNSDLVTGTVQKILTKVTTANANGLSANDKVVLDVRPGLATGIGTTTASTVKLINDYLIVNPLEVAPAGINTTSNRISVYNHGLKTGDKVLYYGGASIAPGLSEREYFVVRVDDNTIQLTKTYKESQGTPNVVNITDVGSSGQSINPIAPQLRPYRNNDLVFDLSDPSLLGYDLKFFYDRNFFNDFVGTGNTTVFEVVGVSTLAVVGVGSTNPDYHPTITVSNIISVPILYYNVFGPSGLSTSDYGVVNGYEIKYQDSAYSGSYTATGIGTTTFYVNLKSKPEVLTYQSSDFDFMKYYTTSKTAIGGVHKVKILDGGYDYQFTPGISSISGTGENAVLIPESASINKLSSVSVPSDVFGYPSDITLKPDAFVPRILRVSNYNTIVDARVTYGGKSYINAPALVLYDKATGEIVDNGLFTCELSDSAVNSVEISVKPVGLTENDYGLAPVRNSNGISIIGAESDAGFLTCRIVTPILGYADEPISIGDRVYVEGIEFNNDGSGFNSGDYKFEPFTVYDYNDSTNPRQVTFNLNGITTNPGTGATVRLGFGQLIADGDLAQFEVETGPSEFIINEPFKRNDDGDADIFLDFADTNTARIIVSGAEPININDILVGKVSGAKAQVVEILEYDGSFNIAPSTRSTVGWRDNIGFMNDSNQVVPDNDYYQNLSYAIESTKTYNDIVNYVNDMVHPSGMKNFANTQIISEGTPGETFIPAEDAGGLVLDFVTDPLRVDAIYNFDLARDFLAEGNVSKFLELRNTRLSDFVLNKTNRVLNIDDISSQFVSNESNDLSDFRVVANYPGGRFFQRFLTQTVYKDEDPQKDQYQLNEFISVTVGEDTYLLQKFEMKNFDQVGFSSGYAQFDTEFDVDNSRTVLYFRPNEPFDTNYEVKSLQQNFSDSPGIGTTSFGQFRLEGSLVRASAASTTGVTTTTEIVGWSTSTMTAAFVQLLVVDSQNNQVDYFEYAVMHDGIDTYLTELAAFNSNQNLSGLSSPRFIGTVTSEIESGVLKLYYENGSRIPVDVKTKSTIVQPSIGSTLTNYRFKIPFSPDGTERTARLEVTSNAKSGIATIVGITSITDLSVKSTVHIGYGDTQTLHQVYLLTDPLKEQNFISEFAIAAIGTTSGIGTFGSTYKPDGSIALEFHPSVAGIVSISAYNEVLYRDLDPNGTLDGIGELNYGEVFESVAQNIYLGINNRDIKSFELKYRGTPIYASECNIADPIQLDRGLGQFNFKHFLSPGEQLTYTPDSNLVGLAGSALVYYTGVGTAYLPETVYAIKNNNSQFQIALSEANALAGIAVTFVPGSGQGNQHRFTMRKRDSKSIISISGLVQKPISYTSINYTLDLPVAGFATAFVLSGISSIQSGDLLKIEDEYSIVRTVGFGTTTLGPVIGIGTYTLVEVERGAVGTSKTAHSAGETVRLFRGSFQILDSDIHFTQAPLGGDLGITDPSNLPYPRATFAGRTFLRNDYTTNQLFDDISESFDGLETTYPLTSIGVAVTGIGSTGGNGVLFINNIFQAPFSENNPRANFKIEETAGISSVVFTGISSFGFTDPIIDTGDINENQLPRGGIIVSLASTPGRGYAPFVGAKVRVEVDAFGAIQNVVGVPTVGSSIGINTASYDNTTGILKVTTSATHGLLIEDQIKLVGLEFSCTSGAGTTTIFPDYDQSVDITRVPSTTELWINVGPSTIPHTYVGLGSVYPWYSLTFGSGYKTTLGTISIGVTDTVGSGATITATEGAGGSLVFSVDHAGSLYTADTILTAPQPNGKDLSVVGNFRLGIGSTTVTGVGCSVTVDILGITTNYVGYSTSDEFRLFEVQKYFLSKPGYGFKKGDKFNLVGLSTDPNAGDLFIPFEIEVIDIFNDDIAAWQFGNIDYIDNIKPFQDGFRTRYPLYYQGQLVSFEIDNNDADSKEIDLGAVLLIFVNGVIQNPDENYVFRGGTSIQFSTPPSTSDDVFIFFYRGTIGNDSFFFDVNEVIKEGDYLELFKSPEVELNLLTKDTTNFAQNQERIVQTITTASVVETPFYQGSGVNNDEYKPIRWNKQKRDRVFGGSLVSKARDSLEPQINPVANVIGVVTTGDTIIYVDNTANFRDLDGLLDEDFGLLAVGFGTTAARGVNVEQINAIPPLNTDVQGYIGFVTGITTSTGIGTDLGLVIQLDTNNLVNDFNASFVQEFQEGYPFKLYGTGVTPVAGVITSVDSHDSDIVAISTYYVDNVYYAHALSFDGSSRTGVITCNIHSGTDITGLVGVGSTSLPIGRITWGRFSSAQRDVTDPISLNTKGVDYDPDLNNYPIVQRRNVGLRNTGSLGKTL